MMKIKKIGLLLLTFAIVVSTVGCGGGNSKKTTSGGQAGSSSDASRTLEAKGSPYAEGIMLKELSDPTVVYMTNTSWDFITEENLEDAPTPIYHAMKIWKEVYGKDVTIDLVDWDSYTDYLITAVASGSAPDVMRYYENTNHPVWPVRNLIAPLEEYMSLDDPDYNIEYSKRFAINGKIYALFGQAMNMPRISIVYNKTKLEQAGQKTPIEYAASNEWNWTNFTKLCKTMTNAAKNDYGLGGWNMPAALPLAYFDSEGKLVSNIDNADYRSYYSKLYDFVITDGSVRRDSSRMDARTTLPQGQDTMAFIETLEYPQFVKRAQAAGGNYEFGLAPIPVYDYLGDTAVRGSKNCVYSGFAISAAPKHSEAAAEFVRLVTKVATNIAKKTGDYGTLTKFLNEDEKKVFGGLKMDSSTDFVNISNALTGSTKYQNTIWGSAKITKTAAQLLEADKAGLNAAITEFENSVQ